MLQMINYFNQEQKAVMIWFNKTYLAIQ
jgi:hypothetical protein